MRLRYLFSLALALLLAVPLSQSRAADVATDPAATTIQTFYAALTDMMKHGKELGLMGRYRQLTPAVEATFDLPAMMQLSVGPAWTMMSDADHKALVDVFERMTIANYAKNFSAYNGEQFTVDPMVQTRNTDRIVLSKLVEANHTVVPFNYRMHQVGDAWKVFDIYLNGNISQLALKRSDFSSTVATSGAAGLVKKLTALVDQQMAGG